MCLWFLIIWVVWLLDCTGDNSSLTLGLTFHWPMGHPFLMRSLRLRMTTNQTKITRLLTPIINIISNYFSISTSQSTNHISIVPHRTSTQMPCPHRLSILIRSSRFVSIDELKTFSKVFPWLHTITQQDLQLWLREAEVLTSLFNFVLFVLVVFFVKTKLSVDHKICNTITVTIFFTRDPSVLWNTW